MEGFTSQMSVLSFVAGLLVLFLKTGVSHGETACAMENNVLKTKQECLQGIRNAVVNESFFWFGTQHTVKCPPNNYNPFALECGDFNAGGPPKSLSSQLFWNGTFDTSKIQQFLHVKYTSAPGEYTGCGNKYKIDTETTFTLDPLESVAHKPFSLRTMPKLTWDAKNDTEYSLLIVDVGHFFMHGVYYNIPGNNMDAETVMKPKPYHGPQNSSPKKNPYAFILLEQSMKNMTLLPFWQKLLSGQLGFAKFNISDFIADHKLEGPVAINWVLAWFDPYSVEKASAYFVSNCATFVQTALEGHKRPFLPPQLNLNVYVDTSFNSPAISFESCCKEYSYSQKTFKLNPIGNPMLKTYETRTETTGSVALKKTGTYPSGALAFLGKYLTLLMVDPDVPIASVGTPERPLVHWLIMNIQEGNLTKGEQVAAYMGPMPPDQKPHTYYQLLYEQPSMLNTSIAAKYAGSCSPNLAGRCLFNVTAFTTENQLQLIGASWMTATNDEYVRYTKIKGGQSEKEICANVPGYGDPCPTSSTDKLCSQTVLYLMAISILSALFTM